MTNFYKEMEILKKDTCTGAVIPVMEELKLFDNADFNKFILTQDQSGLNIEIVKLLAEFNEVEKISDKDYLFFVMKDKKEAEEIYYKTEKKNELLNTIQEGKEYKITVFSLRTFQEIEINGVVEIIGSNKIFKYHAKNGKRLEKTKQIHLYSLAQAWTKWINVEAVKKEVTHKEYKKLVKKAADQYWKENFTIDKKLSAEEKQELRKEISLKFDKELDQYSIIPYVTGLTEEFNNLINQLCNDDYVKEGYTAYTGHIINEDLLYKYMYRGDFKTLFDSGYSITICNDSLNLIIGYTEGDLNFQVCNNKDFYEKEVKRIKAFYEDEY